MGIAEQILAELQAIRIALQGPAQLGAAQPVQAAPVSQAQYIPPQQAAPAQPSAPQNLTADQITALIQPHLSNEPLKAELGNAMRAMGINALPETRIDQYAELYSRFQGIIARFTGGAPVQQQAAPASII